MTTDLLECFAELEAAQAKVTEARQVMLMRHDKGHSVVCAKVRWDEYGFTRRPECDCGFEKEGKILEESR